MHRYDPWDGYRVRRNMALVAYGGFAPVTTGFGVELGRVAGGLWVATVVLVAWSAFLGYALIRLATWPCPRCGRPFLRGRVSLLWSFVKCCPDCGLPKWADPDEQDEGSPESDRPEDDPPS